MEKDDLILSVNKNTPMPMAENPIYDRIREVIKKADDGECITISLKAVDMNLPATQVYIRLSASIKGYFTYRGISTVTRRNGDKALIWKKGPVKDRHYYPTNDE